MPLQFTCPYCQKSQLIPDQAAGQSFACAHCRKVVKIAGAAPTPPLARPVPQAMPVAHVARARGQGGTSVAVYVVVAISVATMATGVTLAILYWPGREQPMLPIAKVPAKVEPAKSDKADTKPALVKKVAEPPEPEPEPDVEPPPTLLERRLGEWYVDGEQRKVRLEFQALDAATVVKELKVVVWTGEVGAPKPASWRGRPVRRGESPRQEVGVDFKGGRGAVEVPLPVLPKDKVYWLQPVLVDAAGKEQWLAVDPWEPALPPLERRPALLAHRLDAGDRTAQLSSQATVTVRDGAGKPFLFNVGVQADAEERLKPVANAATLHISWARVRCDFVQEGIPAMVEKVFGAALDASSKVKSHWQLDPMGTVSKRDANLDDVPAALRKEVVEFDERLAQAFDLLSLHLPKRELAPLEKWTHERSWSKATLSLTATYEGRRFHQKRDEAYLTLSGTLKEAGTEKTGKVEGTALVDLRGGFVMKADLKVETEIIVPFIGAGMIIKGPGVLEVRLTREP